MKKIIFVVAFLFSSVVSAAEDSQPFPLKGGEIKPGDLLVINANDLPQQGRFAVYCDLINSNYEKQYPAVIQVGINSYVESGNYFFKLNGKVVAPYTPTGAQAVLSLNVNKLEVGEIVKYGNYDASVSLRNFDNTDSIQVVNCEARYIVN